MKNSYLIGILFLFVQCDFSTRIDTTAAAKELKARQVKRVLPQEIVNQVDEWGQQMQTKPLDTALRSQYAVRYLEGDAQSLRGQVKDVKIQQVLDALEYSQSMNQEVPPSIQKNVAGDSLYYIYPTAKNQLVMIGFSKVQVIQKMDRKLIK
ncbi:hypothetical protein U0R10_09945 [Aquirufa sp. OSTEICH-129V]|uniref:Uncharacterized protein n=1 Tax=Aquirufa avitistagni TaxID=3104728 RepID=A0ABW6DDI4_9BACT